MDGRTGARAMALAAAFAWFTTAEMEVAVATECADVVRASQRLLIATTADWNAPKATITMFERDSVTAPWRDLGIARDASVGLKGLAWGWPYRHLARPGEPVKKEGDLRSPAGVFAIGRPFGFEQSPLPGYMKIETDQHVCVEDASSEHYGRIIPRSQLEAGIKFDQMRAEPLYRAGFVVDYPPDRATKAGSCIFLHVWRAPGKGTAGCVALDEAGVVELREFVSGAPSAVAIVTKDMRQRFGDCLP